MGDFDVVVIGGGMSGMTTSWELKKRCPQLKIVVLEAKDRLGGRTLTEELPTARGKDSWDLGGQWISSAHKNVLELMSELNLEVCPQYTTGKKFLQLTNEPMKSYSGSIPDISVVALMDFENGTRKISKICKNINVENPFEHPQANEFDSMTLEQFLQKTFWTDTAFKLVSFSIETAFGLCARQISALFFLTSLATIGGSFKDLVETTKNAAQELKIKGGTQQVSILLGDKIGKENVKLSSPVTKIEQVSDQKVLVTLKNSTVYSCKKVVLAIPIPQNAFIEFVPDLPDTKLFLIRNMPAANILKFIVVYEKAFWKDKGFSGEIVNEGKTENEFEAFNCVFDSTTSNGNPALVGLVSAQRSLWLGEFEPAKRRQAILECLAKFLGNEALAPISFRDKNWYHEPYSGGCPTSGAGTGVMDNYQHLKAKFGNVHWAGTETGSVWMGYMEGAVQAGKRASREVLYDLYPNLLTEEEKRTLKRPPYSRRKSQVLTPHHKVFRYAIGLAFFAVGIVVLKKMYFRIAL